MCPILPCGPTARQEFRYILAVPNNGAPYHAPAEQIGFCAHRFLDLPSRHSVCQEL
jgi:hypothetical protein